MSRFSEDVPFSMPSTLLLKLDIDRLEFPKILLQCYLSEMNTWWDITRLAFSRILVQSDLFGHCTCAIELGEVDIFSNSVNTVKTPT